MCLLADVHHTTNISSAYDPSSMPKNSIVNVLSCLSLAATYALSKIHFSFSFYTSLIRILYTIFNKLKSTISPKRHIHYHQEPRFLFCFRSLHSHNPKTANILYNFQVLLILHFQRLLQFHIRQSNH